MNMSLSQARVIDPILTEHSRGYRQASLIGDLLLPIVTMPTRAAKRIEFGREAFRRYRITRAPGGAITRIQIGYEGKPVSLIQRALGATTPLEHVDEAAEVPEIDLLMESVDTVNAVIALDREINQATVARDASKYASTNKVTLSGTAKWSDPASNPAADIEEGKEVIRSRTGKRPTTLTLGATVASSLRVHPKVLARFENVTADFVSDAMLKQFFDVEQLLIGDAIYDDDAGQTVDVWGADALLSYTPIGGTPNRNIPAFGYTYRLRGHPFVEPVYYHKDTRSWINDMFDEWSAEMVGPDAGYLIKDAA